MERCTSRRRHGGVEGCRELPGVRMGGGGGEGPARGSGDQTRRDGRMHPCGPILAMAHHPRPPQDPRRYLFPVPGGVLYVLDLLRRGRQCRHHRLGLPAHLPRACADLPVRYRPHPPPRQDQPRAAHNLDRRLRRVPLRPQPQHRGADHDRRRDRFGAVHRPAAKGHFVGFRCHQRGSRRHFRPARQSDPLRGVRTGLVRDAVRHPQHGYQ